MEKSAGVALEFKDLDTSKRTALIRHSVYNSIDRAGDISHKGMFAKSWKEKGLPKIYINHDPKDIPGTPLRAFDDDEGAYTEMKFGNWTRGNDALEMADAGVFTGASFGYITEKKDFSQVKSRKVRNLREVQHAETSLLTVEACHPEAGLVSLVKSLESLDDNDIEQLLVWGDEHLQSLKSYVDRIEKFCRNTKASDETIIKLTHSLTEYKSIISQYDNAIALKSAISLTDADTKFLKDMIPHHQMALKMAGKVKDGSDLYDFAQGIIKTQSKEIKQMQAWLSDAGEGSGNMQMKNIISQYDTAFTPLATEPGASDDEVKAMLMRCRIALTA